MRLQPHYMISAGLIARALSQTPPDTQPSTSSPLGVSYGSTTVTPGIELPLAVPRTIPTITHSSSSPSNQSYILLLIDLSISTTTLNTTAFSPTYQLPLAPGILPNRTTRLHYFQTDLSFSANGTLINTTSPIARYNPPGPPPGDIPHAYVFYLFEQTPEFTPPEPDSPFSAELVDETRTNRFIFNVANFATESGVGSLAGANYLFARNSSSSSAPSSTGTSATGSVSAPTMAPTTPFLGGVGRLDLGAAGIVVSALAIFSAFVGTG